MHHPPPPPLAKGALALMILLCALLCVAYALATPRLPSVRAAHALAHVTPGRAWSPLRPVLPVTPSDASLDAALSAWLPGAGTPSARAFMAEFEARWHTILSSAPPGSARALRDLVDRLYRRAGRYPVLVQTWAVAHDHCQRMQHLGGVLGPPAAATLQTLTRTCADVTPWLAHGMSELGDPQGALPLIREAVRRDPSHTEALFFYALILLQQPTQDPLALLTFRNLIDDILRREPNFSLLDISAEQLRAERAEADRLLRTMPPAPPPRRVAADALHAAHADALSHALLYVTPSQRLAFAARSAAWWLNRALSPAARALSRTARALLPQPPPEPPPAPTLAPLPPAPPPP